MGSAPTKVLTPPEIIPYGEVAGCREIVSGCEFYDRLGLLARLESSVSQL